MYKICKTEQSASRQRELEQLLLKEMLQRHFDDISISDLCENAGIPRKAFYRYFSGKRSALHALIDHTLMDYDNSLPLMNQMQDDNNRKHLELFLVFWKNNRLLLDAIDRSSLWEELTERVEQHTYSEMEFAPKNAPDKAEPADYLVPFISGGIMACVHQWYHRGFALSPAQLAGLIFGILSQGTKDLLRQ